MNKSVTTVLNNKHFNRTQLRKMRSLRQLEHLCSIFHQRLVSFYAYIYIHIYLQFHDIIHTYIYAGAAVMSYESDFVLLVCVSITTTTEQRHYTIYSVAPFHPSISNAGDIRVGLKGGVKSY